MVGIRRSMFWGSGSVKCRGRSMNRVRASCRWIRIRFSVGVGVR